MYGAQTKTANCFAVSAGAVALVLVKVIVREELVAALGHQPVAIDLGPDDAVFVNLLRRS